MIVVCTPANPSGKVMTQTELEAVAKSPKNLICCVMSDEVYEHYVSGEHPHLPIAVLPGNVGDGRSPSIRFQNRGIFPGWRLGYAYGKGELLAPVK